MANEKIVTAELLNANNQNIKTYIDNHSGGGSVDTISVDGTKYYPDEEKDIALPTTGQTYAASTQEATLIDTVTATTMDVYSKDEVDAGFIKTANSGIQTIHNTDGSNSRVLNIKGGGSDNRTGIGYYHNDTYYGSMGLDSNKEPYVWPQGAAAESKILTSTNTADYIVEESVPGRLTGVWTWRKWNSGIAEAWINISTPITAWNKWGSYTYESNVLTNPIAYPFTFKTIPLEFSALYSGNAGWVEKGGKNTASTTGWYYAIRPGDKIGSTDSYAYINIHVIGYWK